MLACCSISFSLSSLACRSSCAFLSARVRFASFSCRQQPMSRLEAALGAHHIGAIFLSCTSKQ
jgi:hypothetical protein